MRLLIVTADKDCAYDIDEQDEQKKLGEHVGENGKPQRNRQHEEQYVQQQRVTTAGGAGRGRGDNMPHDLQQQDGRRQQCKGRHQITIQKQKISIKVVEETKNYQFIHKISPVVSAH